MPTAPGHAVRTSYLDLELAGIPLRHVEQLVARIDLTGQTAHRLLGRSTSLLELRNLLLLPGDLLFEVGDQPFLRRDLLVGILGRKRPHTEQKEQKQNDLGKRMHSVRTDFARRRKRYEWFKTCRIVRAWI